MAQFPYRCNLVESSFPFTSVYQGRTVIMPGRDQNYVPKTSIAVGGEDNIDRGIPEVYYSHNVMPTAQGAASVGYSGQATPVSPNTALFKKRLEVRDSAGNFVYLAQGTDGHTYILNVSTGVWAVTAADVAGYTGGLVTAAYVNGVTYLYFQGATDPCRQYNFGTNALDVVTLTGLFSNVIGLTAASGYLIAWSATAIAWSSTILATDFTPSLVTGAGSGGVDGAKGAITVCVPILNGLIVYTSANSVAGVFSGNARFPFNFREIVGSGGVSSLQLVAFDANTASHYAYTSNGIQLVAVNQTQTVFPDATDFIAGKFFEDFDEATLTFAQTPLFTEMLKQIQVVAERYFVASYGINELTHAVVYDFVNHRWGKLKVTHVECFEWKTGVEIPRGSLGFLKKDGTVVTVDFSFASTTSAGVLLTGKYQMLRQRNCTLQSASVDSVYPNRAFSLYALSTLDGKTFGTPVPGSPVPSMGYNKTFNFRTSGVNHSLLYVGAFYLSSVVMFFQLSGSR